MSWLGVITLIFSLSFHHINGDTPVWEWKCERDHCQKIRVTASTDYPLSLAACQVLCLQYGALWPKPTGEVNIGKTLVQVNLNSIDVLQKPTESSISNLIRSVATNFKKQLTKSRQISPGGKSLIVTLDIVDSKNDRLTLETDESYALKVEETPDGRLNATITAPTFFGGRHGLETLCQLIIYDDIRDQLQMPNVVSVSDKPVYPYRGVLLDTSRNFISVATLKRTIDGIAASKLNTLHWHITDSHSFPYVSKSQPNLSKLGAYSNKQIYSPAEVEALIQYAKEHGVRLLPEFDAPAHVGEGWQDTDFVACFNKQPWQDYCVEPPCGQFDPTKPKLYDALEGIYQDMIEQFNPDVFHMGGDEVSVRCWNSTPEIVNWMSTQGWGRSEADFMKIWNLFQSQALERFSKHTTSKVPVIMWTSTLTQEEYVEQYLPKEDYIIQIWTSGTDVQIQQLLNKGYKLILSNYDVLYLDCGYAGWVNGGLNWCSPYIGWQKIYDNSPARIGGNRKDQFLGGEAALWTEQVDDSSVDNRMWPRAAAMAERLWAEPETGWRDAESRMLIHRERLVNLGISADALEPQWCLQYDENCPIGGKFNH